MIPVEDVEIAPNPLDQIAAFGGWFNPKLTGGGDLPALAYDVYDGASGWSSGNYVIAVADGIYNFTSGQPAGTLTDRSLNIIAGNIIQYDGTQWNPLQKEIYVPPIIVVADENARLTLDPRELQPQQVVYQEDTQNLWRFVPQQLPPNSNMAEDWQALPVSVTAASRKQEITYDPILAGSTEFVWAHNVDDIEVYKNKTERLYPTEYTADGSVVTLLTPTVESDVITLVTRY
jgi:hypothetical protein